MTGAFEIWVVYDHPKDYPAHYVARLFRGEDATRNVVLSKDLEVIREHMRGLRLTCLSRMPMDDEKILETWL